MLLGAPAKPPGDAYLSALCHLDLSDIYLESI